MQKHCARCGNKLDGLASVLATKMKPAECSECGSKNYRRHRLSYLGLVLFFSLGLIALLFLAMATGFELASSVAFWSILLIVGIFVGEVFVNPLEQYDELLQQENEGTGKRNALLALALAVFSVFVYLLFGK